MSGKEMKAGILTISDKGSKNERIDESGTSSKRTSYRHWHNS